MTVVRNKKYFYTYKILRTNFDETDYSKIVTTELLVADLGDSNGDSSVNVLDVVNCVDYILGNNPGPFIDYATDVNNDSSINVLDVVGIVDLVLNAQLEVLIQQVEALRPVLQTLLNTIQTYLLEKQSFIGKETIFM